MHKCSRCKKNKKNVVKTSSTRDKNGVVTRLYYNCRSCNKDRARKYRNTVEGRKRINAAVYRSIEKLKYKQDARQLVHRALRMGQLKKPKKCVNCRRVRKLEGHHKDHTKPLEVLWFCRPCHSDIEKVLDK